MTDDSELLRQYAQAGSEDSFAELVRRHLPLVYSAALRQVGGDQALAKDVAQSVFIDLARKAASLSGRVLLTGWLYTSTRFAAANAVRQEQRRKARERKAMDMQDAFTGPATEPPWAALSPVLDEAMAYLDVPDRDAVLLRFFERKELKAVGLALGVSEDAARMRVNRALERLRTLLKQRGMAISAAALGSALAVEAVSAAPVALAPAISNTALAAAAATAGVGAVIWRVLTVSKAKVAIAGAILATGVAVPLVMKPAARPPQPELSQNAAAIAPGAAEQAQPPHQAPGSPYGQWPPGEGLPQPGQAGMPGPGYPPMRMPGPRALPPQPQRPQFAPATPGVLPMEAQALRARVQRTGLPAALPAALPRRQLLDTLPAQLAARGITNAVVLNALAKVPRHAFVLPEGLTNAADRTTESLYFVAAVAECLELQSTDRVLELGTGSGYEAAVLAQLAQAVYSLEPLPVLCEQAKANLINSGCTNVFVHQGELAAGWPEAAPFDKMVFNGAPEQLSPTLIGQLKSGGRLVVPVAEDNTVQVFERAAGQLVLSYTRRLGPVPLRLHLRPTQQLDGRLSPR